MKCLETNFKTSYVTVYRNRMRLCRTRFRISKHRMLLFIEVGKQGGAHIHVYFKTSYVTVYREVGKGRPHVFNFKTSYVTVYLDIAPQPRSSVRISKHRMLLFIELSSHTVLMIFRFQNIVCYCLSGLTLSCFCNHSRISKHRMLLFIIFQIHEMSIDFQFQNIVCYCLSMQIHLSRSIITNFKTSYVTVYHHNRYRYGCAGLISKHRMLLFICSVISMYCVCANFKTSYVTVYQEWRDLHTVYIYGFQNIVCYCLSLLLQHFWNNKNDFKTSYVTVYLRVPFGSFNVVQISKHRMLLFIQNRKYTERSCLDFKTSYVTVYPHRRKCRTHV